MLLHGSNERVKATKFEKFNGCIKICIHVSFQWWLMYTDSSSISKRTCLPYSSNTSVIKKENKKKQCLEKENNVLNLKKTD